MERKLLIYVLLVITTGLLIGCVKRSSKTTFKVKNYSDQAISIDYLVYETMDNSVVVIGVDQNVELFISEANSETGYNWYYDYGIQINSIVNTTADTIDFNPNHVQYWNISSNNSGRIYQLGIGNGSF